MADLAPRDSLRAAAQAVRPPGFAAVKLVGKAMTLAYRLSGKDRYDDFRLERVLGLPLLVTPSVFNPKLPRTGAFFAAYLEAHRVAPHAQVLDMGTGSGVCAVFAARHAQRVVAVDINAAAVCCARLNALLNHLEQRIEVRHGDLFAPVTDEQFDLILFNPPFLRGTPRDDRDRAWRSDDVAERFAAGARAHLKPGGSALLLLSSFGGARSFLDELRRHEFAISTVAERRFLTERLAIFRLDPLPRGVRHD
jgi:HemK-related putative methylase